MIIYSVTHNNKNRYLSTYYLSKTSRVCLPGLVACTYKYVIAAEKKRERDSMLLRAMGHSVRQCMLWTACKAGSCLLG